MKRHVKRRNALGLGASSLEPLQEAFDCGLIALQPEGDKTNDPGHDKARHKIHNTRPQGEVEP